MSVLRLGFTAGSIALITGITLAQAQAPVFPARGPDCGSVIARDGPRGVWPGRFSGGREVTIAMVMEREAIQTYQDRPILSVCQRLRG